MGAASSLGCGAREYEEHGLAAQATAQSIPTAPVISAPFLIGAVECLPSANAVHDVEFGSSSYLAVWGNQFLFGSLFDREGTLLGDAPIVLTTSSFTSAVQIVFTGTHWLLFWVSSRQLMCARLTEAGAVLDPEGVPISNVTVGENLKVSFDGTRVLAAWEASSEPRIRGQRVSSDCQAVAGPFEITAADSTLTDLRLEGAAFNGSEHAVVYSSRAGADAGLYAQRVSTAGDPVGSPTSISELSNYAVTRATVSALSEYWGISYRNGSALSHRVMAPNGTLTDELVLASPATARPTSTAAGDSLWVLAAESLYQLTPSGSLLATATPFAGFDNPPRTAQTAFASDGVSFLRAGPNVALFETAVLKHVELGLKVDMQTAPAIASRGGMSLVLWSGFPSSTPNGGLWGAVISNGGTVPDSDPFGFDWQDAPVEGLPVQYGYDVASNDAGFMAAHVAARSTRTTSLPED